MRLTSDCTKREDAVAELTMLFECELPAVHNGDDQPERD